MNHQNQINLELECCQCEKKLALSIAKFRKGCAKEKGLLG